jgi:glycosyltransferase involved in cell wall biosynthesis
MSVNLSRLPVDLVHERWSISADSFLDEVTVLILTCNEARNIGRTLDKLQWARRVIVVDSFSKDETLNVIRQKHASAEIVQRDFDNHTSQWNYGLDAVDGEWVLSLDADYQLTDSFISELQTLRPPEQIAAYYVRFRYCIEGQALRNTLYPPRAVLFRKSRCRYEQNGHTQLLRIAGQHGWLNSFIDHDDRKPLSNWLKAQDRYAVLEARHLISNPVNQLNLADQMRRWILPAPVLVFFYTLFAKRLFFDGWAGWYYVFQRTLAEMLLSLRLIEARVQKHRG